MNRPVGPIKFSRPTLGGVVKLNVQKNLLSSTSEYERERESELERSRDTVITRSIPLPPLLRRYNIILYI